MPKLNRKLATLVPLSAGFVSIGALVSAACSPSNSDSSTIGKRVAQDKAFISYINSTYSAQAFKYDPSQSYGGNDSITSLSTTVSLVRKETLNSPQVVIGDKGAKLIKTPSIWKYSLMAGSKVIVTDNNDQEHVFDNDDYNPEYIKSLADANGNYSQLLYKVKSDNANSINSDAFAEALKNAKKVQFEIRDDIYWSNIKNQKTEFKVVADDFYISWLRTAYLNKPLRLKAIQNDEALSSKTKEEKEQLLNDLDNTAKSLLETGATAYTEESSFGNEYLFNLYNVDSSKFYNRDQFIQTVNGVERVTFDALGENAADLNTFFDAIASNGEFLAAPSQFIKARGASVQNETRTLVPHISATDVQAKKDSLKSLITQLSLDNPLRLAGIYWYGSYIDQNDPESLLASGPYIYAGFSGSATSKDIFEKNRNYYDTEWVNNPNTLNTREYKYMPSSGGADQTQFVKAMLDDYLNGRISVFPFANLTDVAKKDAELKPRKYNLQFRKVNYSTSLYGYTTWRYFAKKVNTNDKLSIDGYSEAFSRLYYGKGISENAAGNQKGLEYWTKVATGYGAVFRNLINAVFNPDYFDADVWNGSRKQLISSLAPDALIGGSDQNSAENRIKTLRDAYEEANSYFILDKDYNKLQINTDNNLVTPTLQEEHYLGSSSDIEKYKSAKYNEVKAAMKALLDAFYAENTDLNPETDKIKFKIPYRFTNWTPTKVEGAFKLLPEIYNALDSRLEVEFIKPEDDNFYQIFSTGNGVYTTNGWGYDYDAIGSGIVGLLNNQGRALFSLLAGNEAMTTKLETSFPTLAKALKAFKAYVENQENNVNLSVPLDKLTELTNNQLDVWASHPNVYKWEDNQIKVNPAGFEGYDNALYLILSKFFLEFNASLTNQENVILVQELNSFFGFTVDPFRQVSVTEYTPSLINPYYVYPYSSNNGEWWNDIFVSL
ncbi:OppA family ABC transporter substrate-binding lipoprotein [Mycoplasmopsis gallinarum]